MNYIMEYPKSAFLYISVLFFCLIFSFIGLRKDNKEKKLNVWIVLIITILSVIAGIRGETVGIDVAHYITSHIEPIRNGFFSQVDQPIGFKLLVWFVYRFTNKTFVVFTVFAFITNGLIILRLWDFRNKGSFSLMLFFYYCYYYLITYNVFRQFISIAIVFYFTRYLEQKKYILYIIIVALACTIHSTAILGFILLPLDILFSEEGKKQRMMKKIFLILSPIIIIIAAFLVYKYFDYDHYLDLYKVYNIGGLGFMTPSKIIVAISIFIIFKNEIKQKRIQLLKSFQLSNIFVIYILGLLLSLLVYFSNLADRFAWYFLMFEPIFMSFIIKKMDYRLLMRGIYIIFAIYTLFNALNNSGQGIMPYITFWGYKL